MRLIDTHCHIHESSYPFDTDEVLDRARTAGVEKLICVGTNVKSSSEAVRFAGSHGGVYASIGIHPHDTREEGSRGMDGLLTALEADVAQKIVAIGEIGLDYHYTHSTRTEQIPLLEAQLQLAVDRDLPVIFHVREAFADFWPIYRNFPKLRGVLHSFTDTLDTLETALSEGLYIGVNGISTFTKVPEQITMFDAILLDKLLLETDAPFLTPTPLRGRINESANVSLVASYHAKRRDISEDQIASTTTASAEALFGI